MSVQANPHLQELHRVRDEMRGRADFVCLDRNERVDPFTAKEMAEMLAGIDPSTFSAYPDPAPLIERLSASVGVAADWIYPTNGSDAAIRKLFQTFVRTGDAVLVAEPTYAMYPIYARMFGAHPDVCSYREDRTLDISRFLERIAAGPRIVAIACPDQPTGAVLALATLRAIAGAAARCDALCVIDEAYFPFYPVTAIELVREFANVAITRTFSKVGGLAGLRLGYLVARPEIVAAVDRIRGAHEVNGVALRAGCYVLDHPQLGETYLRQIEAGRSLLIAAARELGLGCPSSPANFQLLELQAGLDAAAVVESLKKRGFLVKGGFTHPSVARCLRVTLAGPDIMSAFAASLREVCMQKYV